MLTLTRKFSAGNQLIWDRRKLFEPKLDDNGNPMRDENDRVIDSDKPKLDANGEQVYDVFPHVIEAKDPNKYEPREYLDEDYVLKRHSAIIAREQDAAAESEKHKGRKGQAVGKGSMTDEEWEAAKEA